MALTRNFKQTVVDRVERDPAFAEALLDEAATLTLNGESETALLILRDIRPTPTPTGNLLADAWGAATLRLSSALRARARAQSAPAMARGPSPQSTSQARATMRATAAASGGRSCSTTIQTAARSTPR
jgi:hypothetical protein